MEQQLVKIAIEEGLATICFASSKTGNILSAQSCRQFDTAVTTLASRTDIRAVLLSAEGKNFSFGGDIVSMIASTEAMPSVVRELTAHLHIAVARLARLDAPVVARVQGNAFGGAAALAAHCDLVICGRSARFGAAYLSVGLSCDVGASAAFAARMGSARARRFLLLEEVVDAVEAERIGLVDRVIDDELLDAEALNVALKLSRGPTKAIGAVRKLMASAQRQPLEAQLEDEAQLMAQVAASLDATEGINAFVAKRPPLFTGR